MMTPVTPVNTVQELCPDVTTCINDIKIILTGSVCVGKTSLFQRFTNDDFVEPKSYVAVSDRLLFNRCHCYHCQTYQNYVFADCVRSLFIKANYVWGVEDITQCMGHSRE